MVNPKMVFIMLSMPPLHEEGHTENARARLASSRIPWAKGTACLVLRVAAFGVVGCFNAGWVKH